MWFPDEPFANGFFTPPVKKEQKRDWCTPIQALECERFEIHYPVETGLGVVSHEKTFGQYIENCFLALTIANMCHFRIVGYKLERG